MFARKLGGTIFFLIVVTFTPVFAQGEENPLLCNELFGLPEGTIQMEADKKIMNPEVCAAYQFLISRYTPGPRSSTGLSDPKVEGVIKLNPDFALVVAKMLQSAPYMVINSAYRTPEGQGSKDPQSNHIYGCAVDLGYDQTSCNSATCQWVLRNSGAYGLHIRMKYSPEWNHIEPIAKDACRNNSQDVGIPIARSPYSPTASLLDQARQWLGLDTQPLAFSGDQTEQDCVLPDGLVVPCSAIVNRNQTSSFAQSGIQSESLFPMQQMLPSSQQPPQSLPPPTPVSRIILPATRKSSAPKATSTLSVIEQIKLFAEPKTTTFSSATSAPFRLFVSGSDTAVIQSETQAQTSIFHENTYQLTPPVIGNTFTSTDLGGGVSSSFAPRELTTYQKILSDLKSILLSILDYLRPPGRPTFDEYEYDDWSE